VVATRQSSCGIRFFFCEKKSVLEKNITDTTMNPSDPSLPNNITRRNFMKQSALTVGAVTLLARGTGLATEASQSQKWPPDCSEGGECTPGEWEWASERSWVEGGITYTYTVEVKKCTKCQQVIYVRGSQTPPPP
jgi:hypothetical protein